MNYQLWTGIDGARGPKLEKQNTYKHIPNWSEAWQYVEIFSNFFSEIEREE